MNNDSSAGLHRDDAACRRVLRSGDHYGVIGIQRGADEAAIKSAFRRLAREVHPDKNASPLAAEAFKKLQKAYEVLSDSKSRRRYDMYGEEEAHRPDHRSRYNAYYHHQSAPRPEMATVMLPVLLSVLLMLVLMFLEAPKSWQDMQQGAARSWQQKHSKRTKAATQELIVKLTRANADKACGVPGKEICVVLLIDGSAQQREKTLLEQLRNETAKSVRNSRGQSLQLKWAMTAAHGRWASLLPPGATLPWAVVIKPTRTGLRTASLAVPAGGGRTKRRLSEGIPKLLQDVASGSAKFVQLKGNVSKLFNH